MAEKTYALTVQVLARGGDGQPDQLVTRRFAGGLSWQEAREKQRLLFAAADRRHKRRPKVMIVPERVSSMASEPANG